MYLKIASEIEKEAEMLYIGIDLGTSAVKLLLMDAEGKLYKIVSREYPLCFPHPGWSEQNPEDWYKQTVDGIKELVQDVDRKLIAGIGVGGQMHGHVRRLGDAVFRCEEPQMVPGDVQPVRNPPFPAGGMP